MSTALKIMSFNLRLDTPADGANQFIHRKPLVEALLKKEAPDVIGFQEVTPSMRDWLVETLTDYYAVGVGREKDYNGETPLIAFRKDKMALLGADTVMLSNTPHVFGSRYDGSDQSSCPRAYVRVTLKHKEIDEPFHVYNAHTDHRGEASRMLASTQLLQDITSRKGKFFLTGDLNATPDALSITMLSKCRTRAIKDATLPIESTFHDYGRLVPPVKIDYIFTDADTEIKSVVRIEDRPKEGEIYLSDHNPIDVSAEL